MAVVQGGRNAVTHLAGAGEIRRVYIYRGEAGDRPYTPDKGTYGIHKAPRIGGYDIRRGKAEAGP